MEDGIDAREKSVKPVVADLPKSARLFAITINVECCGASDGNLTDYGSTVGTHLISISEILRHDPKTRRPQKPRLGESMRETQSARSTENGIDCKIAPHHVRVSPVETAMRSRSASIKGPACCAGPKR